MIRRVFILILIFLCSLETFSTTDKVLVISSYGTDYQWSNSIMDAISVRLKKTHPSIEFSREFLSSEMLEDSDKWGDKIGVLLRNYQKNLPKAIVLISDEAWMAYRDADVEAFKDVPLILCAVKPHSISTADFIQKKDSLQLSDFETTAEVIKAYRATGIIREMNVPGYLSLMDNLINNLDRFVFITDSRFYGVYTRLLLQEEAKRSYSKIPVEYIDGRFVRTDSLLARLPHIPATAGVLLTSWLTGEYGFEYSKEYLYSQMENKLVTPIFITNNIGLEREYFIGGYFNDAAYWGEKAADMLELVVNGVNPEKIPPLTLYDDQCNIAWKVFHHYKLNSNRLPAKVTYYNAPESFWGTYKYYVVVLIGIFLIFLVFYSYTLRSNIKLQNAQRLLVKSNDEVKAANVKLEHTQGELLVALRKAEESDRLKSSFLANMSHEIRTPLNAIVGFSELMGSCEDVGEKEEYMRIISTNNELLLRLINDILDLSKLESGIIQFNNEEFDLVPFFNELSASMRRRITNPAIEFITVNPYKKCIIETDKTRMTQVWHNFMTNAIKYTVSGYIKMGYESVDGGIRIYVEDTGIGISEDKKCKLFQRFEKLDSFAQGTGLGLSICKAITELGGGKVGFESTEGKGSIFWSWKPIEIKEVVEITSGSSVVSEIVTGVNS